MGEVAPGASGSRGRSHGSGYSSGSAGKARGSPIGSRSQEHTRCPCGVRTTPSPSRHVLPSGLGSPGLQVGQFGREDQGAPRKEKKDPWKNLPTKEGWPVARGACAEAGLWRSIIFKHFILFAKETVWGSHYGRQMSVECVWIRAVPPLHSPPSQSHASQPLPPLPPSPPWGLLGSKNTDLISPDGDLKTPAGKGPNIHQQVNVCDARTMKYYLAAKNEASPGSCQAATRPRRIILRKRSQTQTRIRRDSIQMTPQERQV